MSKREIIDRIMRLNRSARPEFLADFKEEDLRAYMRNLEAVTRSAKGIASAKPAAAA